MIDPSTAERIRQYDAFLHEQHEKIHAETEGIAEVIDPILYKGTDEDVRELEEILTEGGYYQFEARRQLRYREAAHESGKN